MIIVGLFATLMQPARLAEQGLQVIGNTPEQFTAFVKADIDKWAIVVKASGVKLD